VLSSINRIEADPEGRAGSRVGLQLLDCWERKLNPAVVMEVRLLCYVLCR